MSKARQIRLEPVNTLVHYPGNAKLHDLDLLAESLAEHGQYRSVVAQVSTRYVLAGNGTLEAARDILGWEHISVEWVDCDDDTARKIVLVDNRAPERGGGFDDEALAKLLAELDGDMSGTGYESKDLDDLLATLTPAGMVGKDLDETPAKPDADQAVTRPGDLIVLGPHRLLCGDALNPAHLMELMEGSRAQLVVTDPPYLVDYEGDVDDVASAKARNRRTDGKKVTGDGLQGADADEFIAAAMRSVRDVLQPGGSFYVFAPPGEDELRFRLGIREAGLQLRQMLVWAKDRPVFGRQDYHWQHESIAYGWRDGAAHAFHGRRGQGTLVAAARPAASKEHPTQKPVELIAPLVDNNSLPAELVVDLFAGSGTTLVTCAAAGRRCFSMELDPAYCDVIVNRYERLTGETVR
jgi:DNA modification methylase